jgi:KaiC/GvpD/RAD55 family RecA-like ATPase
VNPSTVPTFRLLRDADLEALPEIEWLIDDLLPREALAVLYGPAETGKSFLALDMALSIATGRPWQGRVVQRGPVIYVYAEGQRGLNRRVRAWKQQNGVTNVPVARFLPVAVQLHENADVQALLTAIERTLSDEGSPVLIVIDTLSRCFVDGDENQQRDMGNFVAGAKKLQEHTGSTVLILHHQAKHHNQGNGPRGSNVLRGAADTGLALSVSPKDRLSMLLVCDKQKDGEHFAPLALRLGVVEIGREDSGKPITSCVVVSATRSQVAALITEDVRAVLAALCGCEPASRSAWEKASGLRGGSFNRPLNALVADAYVRKEGESKGTRYFVTEKGLKALGDVTPSAPLDWPAAAA